MTELYREILEGVYEIELLNSSDEDLEGISQERSLGLSLSEMQKIRQYFKKEGRNPTDIELEALAQSWSEHCCYKTSKPILERTVFQTKAPQNICVIAEDAGVVDFNKDYAYVVALESHNHPSALDPYGGAATGIGGILRDVVCMGAQPLALIDPLFFGPLNYPEEKIPQGVKHPTFLFKGVVSGIADYGNRVGIPTVAGMVYFDKSYLGNCLVNVGCIGIVRKDKIARSRAANPGDVYIMAGGKTGRDGIHGVTFASAQLDKESETKDIPAVQLGYAIMKEPLMHACLEVNDKGLLTGMKDFGGGGLSCVASEMAHAGGKGAVVKLHRIMLKDPSLVPWEIWVSESQERMMLSIRPENVDKVLEIFDFWDVPAVVVGQVNETGRIRAEYHGQTVLDLDLDFLIKGVCYRRKIELPKITEKEEDFSIPDLTEIIPRILASQNIGSRESIVRRYDHEVRGNTILKPMQGVINKQSHGDASIIKPLPDSYQGLSITSDVNPNMCRFNPYWGAASAVEEVVRNLVAVNSVPHSMADCLNFGNPEKPDRLGEFVRCCEGLHFAANAFGIPFVSGNVSLYNETPDESVAPTPTLLGIGIVKDVRKAVSSDLKNTENILYLVGETLRELGGSEYSRIMNLRNGIAPKVYPDKTKENMNFLLSAMEHSLICSCHDLSEGGLLVSMVEMALGGDLGVDLDLSSTPDMRTDFKLFSESNGRWLVEVKPENVNKFESTVNAKRIGVITKEKEIKISDSDTKLNLNLDNLRETWSSAIDYGKR